MTGFPPSLSQLMYQARAYRVKKYQFVFFVNALATVASYVIIRFLMVKPQSVIATYQVIFDCATCTNLDIAYSFVCTISLIGINTFNLIKLSQSVLKAFSEARTGDSSPAQKTKSVKSK